MIKIYIASKLGYAERFRKMRIQWKMDGIDLHARWFDQAVIEQSGPVAPEDFHVFWLVDEEDVKDSQAVIIYGEDKDILRGALVEAGIAIAMGKLVIVVGDFNYGTWQYHPMVTKAGSFEHAKTMILRRFR